jgi:hypothetical protein
MISFINLSTKEYSALAKLGDIGLMPAHYLFGSGREIHIVNFKFTETPLPTCADDFRNRRIWPLIWRTALAITLLIPGLILGLCKVLAYFLTNGPETIHHLHQIKGLNFARYKGDVIPRIYRDWNKEELVLQTSDGKRIEDTSLKIVEDLQSRNRIFRGNQTGKLYYRSDDDMSKNTVEIRTPSY